MTNVSLDATITATLMGCPRLADLRFNKDLVSKLGNPNPIEAGALVHIILEFYNKGRIAGLNRLNAIDQGFAAGKEYLKPYMASNKFILDMEHVGLNMTPEGDDKEKGSIFVFKTMEEYFDYYKNDSWTVIAAEETRSKIIYEDSDLRVLWKVKYDEIDDTPQGFLPMDNKTISRKQTIQELNLQFMGQCLLLDARNMIVNKIGFQTSLKVHEKFERAVINYSNDRLEEFRTETIPHYARMWIAYNEAEYFPPNYNHCENKFRRCQFYDACNSDRNIREETLMMNFKVGKKWDVRNV